MAQKDIKTKNIEIPNELLKDLKIISLQKDIKLNDLIIEVLNDYASDEIYDLFEKKTK